MLNLTKLGPREAGSVVKILLRHHIFNEISISNILFIFLKVPIPATMDLILLNLELSAISIRNLVNKTSFAWRCPVSN